MKESSKPMEEEINSTVFEVIANLLFKEKKDTFSLKEISQYSDVASELERCLEIAGKPYGIVNFNDEILTALKVKLENEINPNWFLDWASVSSFLTSIIKYFENTKGRWVKGKVIPYILSDIRLNSLREQNFPFYDLVEGESKKTLLNGLIDNFYCIALTDQNRLELANLCLEDQSTFCISMIYAQSRKNNKSAYHFANYLFESQYLENNIEILRGVLCGIASSSLQEYFLLYKKIYLVEEFKWLIVNAVSFGKDEDPEFLIEVLDLIESDLNPTTQMQTQLAGMYLTYINSQTSKNNLFDRCVSGLLPLINSNHIEILNNILANLYLSTVHDDLVFDCLLRLTRNSAHSQDYYKITYNGLNLFDSVLSSEVRNSELYWDFLKRFVEITGVTFDFDILPLSLEIQIGNGSLIIAGVIVEYLSDKNGKIRFLGNIILEEAMKIYPDLSLSDNLLSLSNDKQLITIFSIRLFSHLNYIDKFKLLFPLFKAENNDVKNLLINTIIGSVDDYPGLLKALELEFSGNESWTEALKVLKERETLNYELKKQRNLVVELSPSVIYPKLFQLHQKIQKQKFSQDLKKNIFDKSIIGTFGNSVSVLKGGGHKTEASNEIYQLNRFTAEFTIPASVFHNPEEDRLNEFHYFSSNLESTNDLKEWLTRFS